MSFSEKFSLLKNPSAWRRLSIATWKAPNDPTVYGQFPIDFTKCQEFLTEINRNSEVKVTVTHLMAKVIALTLARYPDLNGIIRWKRIYLRNSIDIFLQVAIDSEGTTEKPDLSGAKIENCDKKSLGDIAKELRDRSRQIRKKEDPLFKQTFALQKAIPAFMLSWVLRLVSFIVFNLGLSFPKLGMPEDPFGSAMVTSVGMWGVPPGYAPLVPVSRVPLIVCVGQVEDKPWVANGQVVVRPILDVNVTFDHRFIDGLTGSRMANYFRELLSNPQKYLS